jgi:hypothetical protein
MTLYEFNALTDTDKANTVWNDGEFVGDRLQEFYNVLLYQVHAFYVELFYNPEANEIVHLRSFSSTDQVEPYLTKIDLQGLIN